MVTFGPTRKDETLVKSSEYNSTSKLSVSLQARTANSRLLYDRTLPFGVPETATEANGVNLDACSYTASLSPSQLDSLVTEDSSALRIAVPPSPRELPENVECSSNKQLSHVSPPIGSRSLNYLDSKDAVVLRDYQKQLAHAGLKGQNCIICAPTGSGKTYTAGHICQERRRLAIADRKRFKALFIVCIRNLIPQQRDALREIMAGDENTVTGIDDKFTLPQYFNTYDVVVATAQVCK